MVSGLQDMTQSLAQPRPERSLVDELAWCLARFVEGRADEPTMERARLALARCDETALARVALPL